MKKNNQILSSKFYIFFFVLFLTLFSSKSRADWTWNLGYHNPHTATYGLNFLNLWTDWAFEIGIGTIQAGEGDRTSGIAVGGGFSLKYLFMHGLLRPYAQGGFGMSSGVSGRGAGVGISGGYLGAGTYIWSNDFYIYGSYNFADGSSTFIQLGIGFPL